MEFEKLYMFNPFTIQNAESEKIADTYSKLQSEITENADTGFLISKNIELYANMNYLIGEMIARLQKEYDLKKTEISINENKQIYMQRKQWQETNKEKPPAMSYFEAMAKEFVKDSFFEAVNFVSKESAKLANEINSTKLAGFVEKTVSPVIDKHLKLSALGLLAGSVATIAAEAVSSVALLKGMSKDIKQQANDNFEKAKTIQQIARNHFESVNAIEV